MRPLTAVLATALALLAAAPAGGRPASTVLAAARACAPVRDFGPTGRDPADAVGIRVRNISCGPARRIVRRYTRAQIRSEGGPVRVGAFRCSNTYPRVRCSASGGRSISFRYG